MKKKNLKERLTQLEEEKKDIKEKLRSLDYGGLTREHLDNICNFVIYEYSRKVISNLEDGTVLAIDLGSEHTVDNRLTAVEKAIRRRDLIYGAIFVVAILSILSIYLFT